MILTISTAFSQSDTKNIILKNKIELPIFTVKEVIKDLIRKDSLQSTVDYLTERNNRLIENSMFKDSLLVSKDKQIETLKTIVKNNEDIIKNQDIQVLSLQQLARDINSELKKQKRKTIGTSILGTVTASTLLYIILTK